MYSTDKQILSCDLKFFILLHFFIHSRTIRKGSYNLQIMRQRIYLFQIEMREEKKKKEVSRAHHIHKMSFLAHGIILDTLQLSKQLPVGPPNIAHPRAGFGALT